jgi:hypothetical protein
MGGLTHLLYPILLVGDGILRHKADCPVPQPDLDKIIGGADHVNKALMDSKRSPYALPSCR